MFHSEPRFNKFDTAQVVRVKLPEKERSLCREDVFAGADLVVDDVQATSGNRFSAFVDLAVTVSLMNSRRRK